jgi:leader peptidase (prepilin peptidase)/N-methyltransferase
MTPQTLVARSRATELGLGAIGIVAVAASLFAAPDLRGAMGAGLALLMLAIAIVDARHCIIPDELNAAAFALAISSAAIVYSDAAPAGIAAAFLRGAVLALTFLSLRFGYRRLRGREGIGLGDVKLAAVAGAWLDWPMMPVAVELAAVAALTAYTARQLLLGRRFSATNRLPFGLFFAPAIWVTWLFATMGLFAL